MAFCTDHFGFRSFILFCVGCCLSTFPAATFGHEDGHDGEHEHEAAPDFSAKEYYRPQVVPDRIVLNWSKDPRDSIDVSWRTDVRVKASIAQFALADSLVGNIRTGNIAHAKDVTGKSEPFTSDGGTCRNHHVHLDGLRSATMYAYRVGDGENWSEWFQFRTASQQEEPFMFVYFGDAQNEVRSMWSRVIREANQHAPRAAFMLHAGDLINRANADAEWGAWFAAGGWLNGMIPVVATPGNHEYRDGLSQHWRPQFAFPDNGPADLQETVYWFDYQGARIISLNSNEDIDSQKDWLISVLEDEDRPKWTIVTFHHPIFSAARDRDNEQLRNAWRPILEDYNVDLVLQGHDHAYNRSSLGGPTNSENIPEGVSRRDSNTVYVVSVSGPKMYNLQREWEVPRVAGGVQLFQVIHVSPTKIVYEARTAAGSLYDAFTLTKSSAGVSRLFEHVPELETIDAAP